MLSSPIIVTTIIIVVLALCFDFINGFHDCANAIATSVSTRVLTMGQAILMSAVCNFIGAFLSENVAKTVGSGMIYTKMITPEVVMAGLMAAIIWDVITWYYGLPSSSSHALIGGLIGAALMFSHTTASVNWVNFFRVTVLWLILSPIIGFIAGYIFMSIINIIFKKTRPSTVTKVFSKAQIASAGLMALNHGMNDAQKSMGVITMALLSAQLIPTFEIPLWVKIACATAMAIGTSIGGSRIIKTIGSKMARLAPVNGFAAETGAAAVIFTASMFDAPVSTTHIISTAIMGVSASKRLSSVRWVVAKSIVVAWVVTIPITVFLGAAFMYIIRFI